MKILEKLLLVKEIITRLVDSYFKDHYKMIAIDLSKQQAVDGNLRAIQQINFTANSDREGNRSKRNCFGLFRRNRISFVNAKCNLVFISIK